MGIEENRKLVLSFLDNISNGKHQECLDQMADDCSWWLAGSFEGAGTMSKGDLVEGIKGLEGALVDGISLVATGTVAEGDKVAAEVSAKGETVRGAKYDNPHHFVFECKNGKLQKVREYIDTLHFSETILPIFNEQK